MTTLAIIAVALLSLFPFTAFCSNLLYWYETLNSPCPEIPSPRLSLLNCLQIFINSLGGYIIGVCLHPIGWFWKARPDSGKVVNPEKPPLVLVHGINDNAGVWLYLTLRLNREGCPVSTFSYFSLFSDMTTVCSRLEGHIRRVEATHPNFKPILVGHSLGGIIIRRWLQAPANQERIRGVITLATPHGGSKVAALAPGKLGREITPSADLIKTLQNDAAHPKIPCISLITPTDEAVLPSVSLIPPAGWRMRITNRTSHFGMLFCPRVSRVFLEELRALSGMGTS